MTDRKTKTLSYRRAMWLAVDKKKRTLENFIAEAHAILKTVKTRKFKKLDGQIVKCIQYKPVKGGGCFLHLAAETPGDQASTLASADEEKAESAVGTAAPPKGSEFMDGDLFVYVVGDHVSMCATALRDATLALYLTEVFKKAKIDPVSRMFGLEKIANVAKVKVIEAEGVKEIDINASLYDATVTYMKRKKDAAGAIGAAAKHIRALFRKDQLPEKDSLQVGLTLRADDRMKEGKVIGTKLLNDIAKDVLEDNEDDFVIVTRKGRRITKNEIYVRQKVDIEAFGKSIKRDPAWEALLEFHAQLVASGVVVQ